MPSPRSSHIAGHRAGGYTLLEVVIAVGILVMLGSGLATLLTQGISIWRRAENRGRVYDQARILLARMSEDLRSAVVLSGSGAGGGAWVRFICDEDYLGRQRLRFVRTISAETSNAILRQGGQYLTITTPAVYDGRNDKWEAGGGDLGAAAKDDVGAALQAPALPPARGVSAPLRIAGSNANSVLLLCFCLLTAAALD